MESSTGLPIPEHHPVEVRCGICRSGSWRSERPGNAPVLGYLLAHQGTLLYLEEQRLSDRLTIFYLDSAFMIGLIPQSHTPSTKADDEQTAKRLGYPNVQTYQHDATRTAQLAAVGIQLKDLWPHLWPLAAAHWPGRHAPPTPDADITFIDEGPGIRRRRLTVNIVTEGIDTRCRVGRHHHRVPRNRLLRLLGSPQREGDVLYLPALTNHVSST